MRGEDTGINKVIVICTRCGAMAPHDFPPPGRRWMTWHYDGPCDRCGATTWAAHEVNRDWRTGRLLHDDELRFKTKP